MDKQAQNSYSSQTAELLLKLKAIKLSPNDPFTWASGLKSPIYCDNRVLLSDPNSRDIIANYFAEIIRQKYKSAEVIAGVATGAIGIGILVAQKLNLPFIYVRPEAKKHGRKNQIEGKILENQKIVVIEDLISTGKSSLNAVEALQKNGVDVLGVFAIFSYDLEIAKINFEKANQKFYSLSDFSALIECSKKYTGFSNGDLDRVNSWKKNHANWIV